MEVTFQNKLPFEFTATEYCSILFEGREYNIVVEITGGSGNETDAEMDIHILEHGLGYEQTERINELITQKFACYTLSRSFAA